MSTRRLSQAISEGDGISVLVEVGDVAGARAALEQGAEGVVLRGVLAGVREATELPVLAYGPSLTEAAHVSADAIVLRAGDLDDLIEHADSAAELGLECVIEVRHEDDLERALEHLDPEIFLLLGQEAHNGQSDVARLLELLPDVPAGKLAIGELSHASRHEVEELERSGFDAVIVREGEIDLLVGDGSPEV